MKRPSSGDGFSGGPIFGPPEGSPKDLNGSTDLDGRTTEPELEPPGDPVASARIICLRLLDQRARTRVELARALTKKGIPEDAANSVLDRFTEVGLIDDQALALSFATARHSHRRLAPRAISAQLRRRGVEDETIASAVSGIDGDSERRAARELVKAKLRRFDGVDPAVATRRLAAMLARRGYSSGVAFATVREVLREQGTDAEEPEADI